MTYLALVKTSEVVSEVGVVAYFPFANIYPCFGTL
jgi:hypothetical protein